jgi:hypothetical protein
MKQIKEYEDGMNNPALFQIADLAEEYENMESGFVPPAFFEEKKPEAKEEGPGELAEVDEEPEEPKEPFVPQMQFGAFDPESFLWSD